MLKKYFYKKFSWENFAYLSPLSFFRRIMLKNAFTHWLFVILPFLFTGVLFIIMETENVLVMSSQKTSFLDDTSNSVCMPVLLITSYFLGSIIPTWIKRGIDNLKKYSKNKDSFQKTEKILSGILFFGCVVSLPLSFFGLYFVETALSNSNYWMTEISFGSGMLYKSYLVLCWYFSVCLLLYVIAGCYAIKRLLSDLDTNDNDTTYIRIHQDFQDAGRTIGTIISYAVFYIIGGAVIIINDNTNQDLSMTFSNNFTAPIILILFILMGFAFVLLPVIEFSKTVRTYKRKKICAVEESTILSADDKEIKRKQLENISSSVFESTISKTSLFLSITGPIIPLLIELIK